jgi:penicillin-insensitive murein endopeptidase
MVFALFLVTCLSSASLYADPPSAAAIWGAIKSPAVGPALSIGGFSAGCVQGAVALPLSGDGFRVTRPERHRVFGHPLLVSTIRELGARVKSLALGFLPIGDLSQPRGGPAPTGHASHQTGLDVDIWYAPPTPTHDPISMIDAKLGRPARTFTAGVARIIELFASDPRVDRLFVHPILKRALCESAPTDRAWLRKVRPWWGHHDHFHARLACPSDSPACEPQSPLPAGDGCNELAWWFNPAAQAERDKNHQTYSSKVGASPPLPEGCRTLLDEPKP